MNNAMMDRIDQTSQSQSQQQQSQIIANIENNSINFDLDDDGFSQISFKQHLRQEEGNSSRGSLHNVYDNMSVSTTNTSATTRNYGGDTDSNFLRMIPGLKEVNEAESDENKLAQNDQPRTSIFKENQDILDDQNYPKLYYRHSTFLLPTTAKNSVDEPLRKEKLGKRRNSDTKLLSSLHFENEFLVKSSSQGDAFGSPTKHEDCDQLEVNIQNILDITDESEDKPQRGANEALLGRNEKRDSDDKKQIFKSLPNLEM